MTSTEGLFFFLIQNVHKKIILLIVNECREPKTT